MSNNKYKILVIEDETNILRFVGTILETNGYQMLSAQSCAMGKTMLLSHNQDPGSEKTKKRTPISCE